MDIEQVGGIIVDSAIKVHTVLGPGLLESAYEACLAHELDRRGLNVKRQFLLPLEYEDARIDVGYRLDLLVNDSVIVELKAVERLLPVHKAQLLSYLKLSKCKLGFLLNFNVVHMKDGIRRLVNGL